MLHGLWLIPVLPLVGFLVLALDGGWLSRRGIAVVGAGSVGLAALAAILIGIDFLVSPPREHTYGQVRWTWMDFAGLTTRLGAVLAALPLARWLPVPPLGVAVLP